MKAHQFYKKYQELSKASRFEPYPLKHTTSAFIIYKELEGVRAQLRYFQMREEELLAQAEEIFNNGKI